MTLQKYPLNSLLYKAKIDPAFREGLFRNPEEATNGWDLTPEVVQLIRDWDILSLNKLGANLYLLVRLSALRKPEWVDASRVPTKK